ncbi:hypothetical protein EVAR_21323_1, partial [Eumeta japonica]
NGTNRSKRHEQRPRRGGVGRTIDKRAYILFATRYKCRDNADASGATRPSRATEIAPRPPLCGRSDDKTGCTLVKLKPGLTVSAPERTPSDIRDPMATPHDVGGV